MGKRNSSRVLGWPLICWLIAGLLIAAVAFPFIQIALPAFPLYGKGGVGVVGRDLWVITDSTRNTIVHGKKHEWTGKEFEQPETVFANEEGVIPVSWAALGHLGNRPFHQIIIRFTSNNIYFYDFIHFSGGHYRRNIEGK